MADKTRLGELTFLKLRAAAWNFFRGNYKEVIFMRYVNSDPPCFRLMFNNLPYIQTTCSTKFSSPKKRLLQGLVTIPKSQTIRPECSQGWVKDTTRVATMAVFGCVFEAGMCLVHLGAYRCSMICRRKGCFLRV
jgi:hypothetical protein